MILWNNGRAQMWYGYTDLGPIQIMPVPKYIVLTDRADGSLWWLSYTTNPPDTDGFGYITIESVLPQIGAAYQANIYTYAAYEEPYIGDRTLGTISRLIVRGGYLGAEALSPPRGTRDENSMRLFALLNVVGFNSPMREIILSVTEPTQYAWVPETVTQTPNPAPNSD